MNIYARPVIFAIVAAVVVSIGTLITTFIPLFMPSTQPVSKYVKPYSAIELEGRDIYIREGCNNCHTQTVRPLRTEVARYGEYSKPEEFAYDRPFLWGSRRTGPDLARIGGKYPDSWHLQHTVDPQSMFPKSNMPPYRWLAGKKLDTKWTFRKISVLGYGLSEEEVTKQLEDFRKKVTSEDYPSRSVRERVLRKNVQDEITELDALVAYIQKIGRDLKELEKREKGAITAKSTVEAKNPYEASQVDISEIKKVFLEHCASCHGEDGKGKIGPDLTDNEWKYGSTDTELFSSVSGGRPGGMPPFKSLIGEEKIWKAITYIRSLGGK